MIHLKCKTQDVNSHLLVTEGLDRREARLVGRQRRVEGALALLLNLKEKEKRNRQQVSEYAQPWYTTKEAASTTRNGW